MTARFSERSPRVLVVDDYAGIRKFLIAIFTEEGYYAVGAEDGIAALDLLARESYDLVVTDVKIPGMDGLEVVRAVHEMAPDTSIVLMTGEPAYLADATNCRALALHDDPLRVDAYWAKPLDVGVVLGSVHTLLGQ